MPNGSWSCFVTWLNLGSCVVSFTKDSRSLVTLLTQLANQQHWCSRYKSLLGDIDILATSCHLATSAMKGLIWHAGLRGWAAVSKPHIPFSKTPTHFLSWSICVSTALTTLIASDGSLPFKQLLRAAVKLSTWNRNSQIHLWIKYSSALLTGDLLKTAQDWCLILTSKTAMLCRV